MTKMDCLVAAFFGMRSVARGALEEEHVGVPVALALLRKHTFLQAVVSGK